MSWAEDLADAWDERATILAPYAEAAAEAFKACANDLRTVRKNLEEELLTLTEAAKATGYSRGHLGRLVRQGKIPNHGRKHAPRVRLSDLPKKKLHPSADVIDLDEYRGTQPGDAERENSM